jgi:hypothetical protein
VQHSNAKNAILFETISLIIHYDRCCWVAVLRRDGPGLMGLRPGPTGSGGGGLGAGLMSLREEGWAWTPGSVEGGLRTCTSW